MSQQVTEAWVRADALAGLIVRVGRGDRGAFEQLYDQSAPRVYAMIRKVLVNPVLSEDATQEVYLQVWRSADQFDPVLGSPTAWLFTLAHRRAVDMVRREQARKDRQGRYLAASHVIVHDETVETVLTRYEAEEVKTSLTSLSPLQHEAIKLAFYGGLTYPEIAAQLNIPLPTIKSRIRDGLIQLRKTLSQ